MENGTGLLLRMSVAVWVEIRGWKRASVTAAQILGPIITALTQRSMMGVVNIILPLHPPMVVRTGSRAVAIPSLGQAATYRETWVLNYFLMVVLLLMAQ